MFALSRQILLSAAFICFSWTVPALAWPSDANHAHTYGDMYQYHIDPNVWYQYDRRQEWQNTDDQPNNSAISDRRSTPDGVTAYSASVRSTSNSLSLSARAEANPASQVKAGTYTSAIWQNRIHFEPVSASGSAPANARINLAVHGTVGSYDSGVSLNAYDFVDHGGRLYYREVYATDFAVEDDSVWNGTVSKDDLGVVAVDGEIGFDFPVRVDVDGKLYIDLGVELSAYAPSEVGEAFVDFLNGVTLSSILLADGADQWMTAAEAGYSYILGDGAADPEPPSNVPEPVSIAIWSVALIGVGARRRVFQRAGRNQTGRNQTPKFFSCAIEEMGV